MYGTVVHVAYLVASILFMLALRGLAHPRTAVRGNLLGALGMLLAIVVTLLDRSIVGFGVIIAGAAVGAMVGVALAVKVPMTGMPQMVALLNGFGGLASVLVAGASLVEETARVGRAEALSMQFTLATAASGLIGAVTFWGSMVAFDKLQVLLLPRRPIHFRGQQRLNAALAAAAIALSAWIVFRPADATVAYGLLVLVASVMGVLLTIPVGGADMPVAIALLNSYSGLAAAATGFVLFNDVLVIAGSLVGASGIILTQIMCRAMNRSLLSVLTGLGPKAPGVAPTPQPAGLAATADPEPSAVTSPAEPACESKADPLAGAVEAARNAGSVIIVPGYGMALAQAQFEVVQLARKLEEMGKQVRFAVHPVAGRMPGHMHVLLAEAEVDYEKLYELDRINQDFRDTDLVLIVGACDVVNPAAIDVPGTPISGMPILLAREARHIVVCNLDERPGYSGVENPLYRSPKTILLLGDAKGNVAAVLQGLA